MMSKPALQRAAFRVLLPTISLLLVSGPATAVQAQAVARSNRRPVGVAPIASSLQSLDEWIVLRFRGVQLLPDSSARGNAVTVTSAGAPRIEASRHAGKRDTVVALHFNSAFWRPALNTGANVQLADPSGVTSTISGRVAARRAFRAPRVASARDPVNGDWRIGWAYLIAIPARMANAAPAGFDGWAILEAPSKTSPRVLQSSP
ncbi:MAG: hypothetical protein M3Y64_07765 [Gemmatimonadota bacterium]|nr:hypothetical protein [Gemmatimonadota bacterium]